MYILNKNKLEKFVKLCYHTHINTKEEFMNWFEKIVTGLSGTMIEPTNYGWFHLMFVAFVIIATILLCWKMRNVSDKWFRRTLLIIWIVIVVLEIYKQVVFSFDAKTGIWDYQWYAFPYQLCSTQLYILPFVIFLRDGKVRDACIAYLSTFSFFGGLAVFFYPNDVFIPTIGINIQTMIHHGLQVVLGIYLTVYNRKKLSIKFFLKGVIVFVILTTIAMIMNLIVPKFITNETFNMFYISPYFECTLPVVSLFYPPTVPYIIFLLIYILGFTAAAIVLFYIQYGIIKLCTRKKNA